MSWNLCRFPGSPRFCCFKLKKQAEWKFHWQKLAIGISFQCGSGRVGMWAFVVFLTLWASSPGDSIKALADRANSASWGQGGKDRSMAAWARWGTAFKQHWYSKRPCNPEGNKLTPLNSSNILQSKTKWSCIKSNRVHHQYRQGRGGRCSKWETARWKECQSQEGEKEQGPQRVCRQPGEKRCVNRARP